LRPGSFAKAEIVSEQTSMAPIVPKSAIVAFAGIEKVIMVDEGKALEKPVVIGRRTAEWVEVLSGVNVGDLIVIEPGNLQTGQSVVIVD
jgi:multidrug efflux pump subunit AcrA (membrane-fusion protein)